MKQSLLIITLIITASTVFAQNGRDSSLWVNDVNQAHALSKMTGKPIFAFFTGSDWCGWCRKLQKEVFAKPAFMEWASSEVVLLELDYPARKVLPENIVQQNAALKNFFKITGFPTVWLFCINEDKEKEKHFTISPYGSLGYPRNPVPGKEEEKFLAEAKGIIGERTCK